MAGFVARIRPSAWRPLLVTARLCQALHTPSEQATRAVSSLSISNSRTELLGPVGKLPPRRNCGDFSTDVTYTDQYFRSLVEDKPLVLFMKGDPSAPMCGFSRLVVQILHMHGVESYDSYDVLEDVEFKEGMKRFSSWPTFPQVYINGELLGGADIVLQMHQSGELIPELERIGHRSLLSEEDSSS